jgi:hypothetical protein
MLLNKRFQAFVEQRPICVMARGILERVFEPQRLNDLFARHAQAGYTKKLHFATLVHLMADVVLGVKPSVNAAFQALEQRPDGVSKTAVYNKLDRVETVVSEALVRDAAAQCAPAIAALGACYPPWLPGFRCRVLDGNHLSATEHRLEPLRTIWDAPLPGKALVVLDQERLLAEHVFLTEDGHAQERSLLDAVLPCVQPNDLWIADRNFCTLKFLFSIAQRLGFFVIRQHGTVKGILLGRQRKIGRSHTGVVYEQTIGLTNPETGTVKKWRRITVQLKQPTRDGNTELHLLTNVRPRQASAGRIAELYQRRWTIETLFHEVTMTLECEIQTLGYPKAALFAFCLALVAYNAVSLLKASLRAVHGVEKGGEQLSGYQVALEVRGTYDGMMVAIPELHWHIFQTMSVAELVAVLKEIATYARLERYRKQPRGPKKPPPKKQKYNNGGHASTYKLLNRQK